MTLFRHLVPALLFAAVSAASAAEGQGGTVSRILLRTKSDVPIDETLVRSYLAIQPGDPVDPNAIAADVRALLDSNRYTDVAASTEASPKGGVDLVFVVEPRRSLAADPTYKGRSAISRSSAEKAANLRPGDLVDMDVANAAAARLREAYRKKRYFDATVSASLESVPDNPGAAYVVFDIEEGDRYHVDFLKFPGATSIDEDSLGRHAQLHSWYNPLSWIMNKRVGDVDLDAVAGDARRQLLDAGHLDATVAPPRKEREDGHLKVSYDVVEGPVYHVGSIELKGVTLFPESEVRAALSLKPGDVAGAAAMEADRSAVRDVFASRGHPDTRVTLTTAPAPGDHRLALVYHVEEGPLVTVRSVNIRGNTATKDKVIRREVVINPGEPYDAVRAERSRRRLMNLGYFEDVRLYDAPAGEGETDVFFEVDERRTGSIMFGAGFSSVDHLIGLFNISQSNFDLFNWPSFRGGGQRARLDLTVSADSTDLDISWVEPWFLDRRLALEVDAFIHNREYDEYEERRIGGSIGLAKMVPWIGRVGIDYGIEAVTLDDVTDEPFHLASNPETAYSFLDEDDDYLLGSLRLSWTYDTRDQPLVPHHGTRAQAHLKLYNAAFGSDYDFYEANLKAYKYFTLPFGFLLSFSGRIATVDAMGDDEVPIGSRFFLGGGRYIRGFRHRAVGPKALSDLYEGDYSAIGGQSLLWGTAELSLPLVDRIRLAAFYDVGNVWRDEWDWGFDDLATSCGVGLRLDYQGFPIRLDYAHIIDPPDDYARTRNFVFWIGFDN